MKMSTNGRNRAELLELRESRIPEVRQDARSGPVTIKWWQGDQIERGQQDIERNERDQEDPGEAEIPF